MNHEEDIAVPQIDDRGFLVADDGKIIDLLTGEEVLDD